MRLTVLTRTELQDVVRMPEAIALMREAFAEIGRGAVEVPDRVVLGLHDNRDVVLFMPGHLARRGEVGIKIVSVFPDNPTERNLPTITATILLIDAETGEARAVMDGACITALRTGAISGLATDFLARPDARVLVVYGAGAQARTQVEAVLHVRPAIEQVVVCAPNREKATRFAEDLTAACATRGNATVSVTVSVASDPDDAASLADIIVTATTARTPVFDGRRVQPGVHINAIGSFKPDVREVDDAVATRARIFVDERTNALREAGDLLIPIAGGLLRPTDVCADLADLVLGRHPGRQHKDEVTLFKSVGHAAADIIVATRALQRATATGVGLVVGDRPPPNGEPARRS